MIEIVWDEPKRLANIDNHRLDFRQLDLTFFEGAVLAPARIGRFKAVGLLDETLLTVIFSPLGGQGLSIISMRVAGSKERKLFHGR